jgi:hypothetical protein
MIGIARLSGPILRIPSARWRTPLGTQLPLPADLVAAAVVFRLHLERGVRETVIV